MDRDTRIDELSKIVWRWRSGQLSRRTALRLLTSFGVSLGGGLATIRATRGMDHHPGHIDEEEAAPVAEEAKLVNTDVDTDYDPDLDPNLLNPERGIYYWSTFNGDEDIPTLVPHTLKAEWLYLGFDEDTMTDYCNEELIWNGHHQPGTTPRLNDYADKLVGTDTLVGHRQAGTKVVFRPRYDNPRFHTPDLSNGCHLYQAVDLGLQRRHIDAVAKMLGAFKDVIAFIEAGFLGHWGEWNTADFPGSAPLLDSISDREAVLRHILEKYDEAGLLQHIGLRRPVFAAEAIALKPDARVGIYNDCFMADNDDQNTYRNFTDGEGSNQNFPGGEDVPGDEDAERAHWKSEARKLTADASFGGETCPKRTQNIESWRFCSNMIGTGPEHSGSEPASLHMSYLHGGFSPDAIKKWETGDNDGVTCYKEIRSALGYRFEVTTVEYTKTVTFGQNFLVRVHVTNTGWSKLHKPRQAWLVLRDGSGAQPPYEFSSGDVASWAPGQPTTISVNAPAPNVGEYEVRLWIPDPDAVLRDGDDNPIPEVPVAVDAQSADQKSRIAYSVKLATLRNGSNVFVPTSGENYLCVKIKIVEPQPVDRDPPVISGVNVTITNATTSSYSAIIGWSTSELADSQVEYGPSPNLGTFAPPDPDPDLTTAHFVHLTGLDPNFPQYRFEVRSRDAAGNLATAQGGFSPPPTPG